MGSLVCLGRVTFSSDTVKARGLLLSLPRELLLRLQGKLVQKTHAAGALR